MQFQQGRQTKADEREEKRVGLAERADERAEIRLGIEKTQAITTARLNKLELSDQEYDHITEEVRAELSARPLALPSLLQKMDNVRKDKLVETIRWLKDHGQLEENEKKELIWQS